MAADGGGRGKEVLCEGVTSSGGEGEGGRKRGVPKVFEIGAVRWLALVRHGLTPPSPQVKKEAWHEVIVHDFDWRGPTSILS